MDACLPRPHHRVFVCCERASKKESKDGGERSSVVVFPTTNPQKEPEVMKVCSQPASGHVYRQDDDDDEEEKPKERAARVFFVSVFAPH